jgi:uncharacterized cupin superfamily protein
MQHNHTIKYTTLRNRGETNLKQLKVEEMQQKNTCKHMNRNTNAKKACPQHENPRIDRDIR